MDISPLSLWTWTFMKNNSNKPKKVIEMRAEYDFSGGVRGKHAAAYHQGHFRHHP